MATETEREAVVFAGLMPHAPILVAGVGGPQRHAESSVTIHAMTKVAQHALAALPDTVLVISPHSPRRTGSFGLWRTPLLRGSFEQFGARETRITLPLDDEFTKRLFAETLSRGVPTWNITQGTLDHGAAVPLSFLAAAGWHGPTVVIGLTEAPGATLDALGQAIAATATALNRRLAVIASGDMSHRVTSSAPAGYHQAGARFDHAFLDLLRGAEPKEISQLDPNLIADAAEDVVEPTLVALAAAKGARSKHAVLSYEAPFGVGYGVAILAEAPPIAPPGSASGIVSPWVLSHPADLPRVARKSVTARLANGPVEPPYKAAGPLLEPHGIFVSLRAANGALRGCCGAPTAQQTDMVRETWRVARVAAFEDPRFPPLKAEELSRVWFSVSVLGAFEPAASAADLDPALYGIVIQTRDGRRSLLLPGIQGIERSDEQLRAAKRKAGVAPIESVQVQRFRAQEYSEPMTEGD